MKNLSNPTTIIISCFYILLFVYASISKILDFENFQSQIALSPLLSNYANSISYGVIISELVIVSLLFFQRSRIYALYGCLGLMSAFTIYIYLILNYCDFIPCSCGGILEKLTWNQHLVFNIICVILSVISIYSFNLGKHKFHLTSMIIFLTVVFSCGLVVLTFIQSEYMMKYENNFTRRFHHHLISDEEKLDLKFNSYYFAGNDDNNIYLGNSTTPLIITIVDKNLKNKFIQKLEIPTTEYQFRNLQLITDDSRFTLFDGSVPVVYQGKINEKKPVINSKIKAYFNQALPMDSSTIIFRAKNTSKDIHILGKSNLTKSQNVELNEKMLSEKNDGIFGSDGQLLYNKWLKKILYIHYYRNQILVIDEDLKTKKEMKTIDTISKSNVATTLLKDGTTKFSKPPQQVNLLAATHKNLLFVNSNLRGRHEDLNQWNKSSAIDIYDLKKQNYVGSFYIDKSDKKNIKQLLATDNYLYVLKGQEIFRYRFARLITDHFLKGEAENPDQE